MIIKYNQIRSVYTTKSNEFFLIKFNTKGKGLGEIVEKIFVNVRSFMGNNRAIIQSLNCSTILSYLSWYRKKNES